jgi:peptidoglycan L-alanyl-D-glutamate endopeptidase CwlK
MTTISGSVGEGGDNLEADVRTVQQLLTKAGHDPKGIDGDYGTYTRDAILSFQRTFLSDPDGRIDPGGQTLKRLDEATQGGGAATGGTGAGGGDKPAFSDWSGDSSQWPQEKKLASLEPGFRAKIVRVIAKLKNDGFQPKIVFGWRSVAVQQRLVAQGKSTVRFSFHNAQKPDGTPNAWAVDVIDARWSWNEPDCHKFFKALGDAGKAEGLVWGGDWTTFKDWAHLQGRQNSELGAVRRESGL